MFSPSFGSPTELTHLSDRARRGSFAHDWNFVTASLPGLSPCDRSSWSWKQWQGPAGQLSTHRQWHTRTLLSFPTHLQAYIKQEINCLKWKHSKTPTKQLKTNSKLKKFHFFHALKKVIKIFVKYSFFKKNLHSKKCLYVVFDIYQTSISSAYFFQM